jgi:hypothetical protein
MDRTLQRLVAASDAVDGLLFAVNQGRLELAAPAGAVAPDGLVASLQRALEHGLGWQDVHRSEADTYRPIVLRGVDERPVAVAALRAGDAPLHPPDLPLIAELADSVAPTTHEHAVVVVTPSSSPPPSDPNVPETIVED